MSWLSSVVIVKSLDSLYKSLKLEFTVPFNQRGTANRGLLMRLSREISKPNLYTRDSTARAGEHLVQPLFSILIYSNHDARYELEQISTIKDALDPIIPRIPRKQVFHYFSNYIGTMLNVENTLQVE